MAVGLVSVLTFFDGLISVHCILLIVRYILEIKNDHPKGCLVDWAEKAKRIIKCSQTEPKEAKSTFRVGTGIKIENIPTLIG